MKSKLARSGSPVLAGLRLALSLSILSVAIAYPSRPVVQQPTPDQAAFFEAKIRPIIVARCLSCHGQTQMGGLRLDSLAGLQKGGDSGPAIVPGDPDKSLLIQAIRQTGTLKMPQGGKLDASAVTDFEAWVKMGAPWPSADTNSGKSPLWSLQSVKKPPIPKVKNPS